MEIVKTNYRKNSKKECLEVFYGLKKTKKVSDDEMWFTQVHEHRTYFLSLQMRLFITEIVIRVTRVYKSSNNTVV